MIKNLNNLVLKQVFNLSLIILLASCSCNKNKPNPENITINEITYPVDEILDEQEIDEQVIDEQELSDDDFTTESINYGSGLKCEVLRSGPHDTKLPAQGQTLTVHYSCWYNQAGEPGETISSSYDQGTPVEFKVGVGDVIRAWDEALMDMHVGDKWRLYVPSELAFGTAGADQLIPGDSDLIYDIELIDIK